MNEDMNHLFATRQFVSLLESAREKFKEGNLQAFDIWLLNLIAGNTKEAEVIASEAIRHNTEFFKPHANFLFRNQEFIKQSTNDLAAEIFAEWDQEAQDATDQ